MSDQVVVTKDIAAPAATVWALVSDLPRMGEWSPENCGGQWVKGATGRRTSDAWTCRGTSDAAALPRNWRCETGTRLARYMSMLLPRLTTRADTTAMTQEAMKM